MDAHGFKKNNERRIFGGLWEGFSSKRLGCHILCKEITVKDSRGIMIPSLERTHLLKFQVWGCTIEGIERESMAIRKNI